MEQRIEQPVDGEMGSAAPRMKSCMFDFKGLKTSRSPRFAMLAAVVCAVYATCGAAGTTERVAPPQASVLLIPHIREITADGSLAEWKDVTPLEIMDGHTVPAKVYIGWGTIVRGHNAMRGLAVAFDVTTSTPWRSAATPQLAFQGGAAVEFRVGPADPQRTQPGPGDARIVAAPVGPDGKTLAVEMLPVLPQGWNEDSRQPATYQTMNGTITFARVAPLGDNWAVAKLKDDGSGYIVEMLVPLRPPLDVQPGLKLRLDASVVLPDAEGIRSEVRLPWHSRTAGEMGVVDTYFDSLLYPQNWAEAELDSE